MKSEASDAAETSFVFSNPAPVYTNITLYTIVTLRRTLRQIKRPPHIGMHVFDMRLDLIEVSPDALNTEAEG